MSKINLQDLNSPAVPFFARYLEGQCEELSVEEMEAVTGGCQATTKKYPSDLEDGGGGIVTTLKYPSDNEDGGGGIVTTQKYPSDGDDEGFSVE
ncbi:microviridin/marinostatin family tricyclic proteinase inhibitor [Scytonema sp. PCC 10023]|uniref:microviridin/marinostatin family tricyclic proteinase inhibitor n=1 Tax=Scytonema sp. PCC 10023 TaxID=1680591 RepID=UPI0039C5D64A